MSEDVQDEDVSVSHHVTENQGLDDGTEALNQFLNLSGAGRCVWNIPDHDEPAPDYGSCILLHNHINISQLGRFITVNEGSFHSPTLPASLHDILVF